MLRECDRRTLLTMYNKDALRWLLEGRDPPGQMITIRMTADSRKIYDRCLDIDLLTKKFYLLDPIEERMTERSRHLISNKQNRGIRSPQIMLQMMADATSLTHTGCRDDNLRLRIHIDHLRFITCDCDLQSVKLNWIHTRLDQFQSSIVKAVCDILVKDIRCLNCERTIDIYFKIRILRQQVFRLDPTHEVKHLLRTSN